MTSMREMRGHQAAPGGSSWASCQTMITAAEAGHASEGGSLPLLLEPGALAAESSKLLQRHSATSFLLSVNE